MSDNTKIPGPQDPNTININQPHEVSYWAKKLGVTEAQLLRAVNAVGPRVADVRSHLGK